MSNDSPGAGESGGEPELAPLVCVACGAEYDPEHEPWPETCPACGRSIDLRTQFAYCRGRDAFIAGQDLLMRISPKIRKKTLTTSEELEGVQYCIQAYSALQLAFQGELAEHQRRLGIEMMAAIAQVFQQHNTVSPLESGYWQTLMVELATQIEREDVLNHLAQLKPGPISMLPRWRWKMRLKQLDKSLFDVDQKITRLEQNIRFTEKPRARRKTLPPDRKYPN
jgi:predicted RNA-binding Zn-ribbon protein involved in translation (DUF1610 family)